MRIRVSASCRTLSATVSGDASSSRYCSKNPSAVIAISVSAFKVSESSDSAVCNEDKSDSRIYYFLSDEHDHLDREDNLSEIEDELMEINILFKCILHYFKSQTNISIYPKIKSKNSYHVIFCLDLSELFVLSEDAKKLKDNGFDFELKQWVESEYIQ